MFSKTKTRLDAMSKLAKDSRTEMLSLWSAYRNMHKDLIVFSNTQHAQAQQMQTLEQAIRLLAEARRKDHESPLDKEIQKAQEDLEKLKKYKAEGHKENPEAAIQKASHIFYQDSKQSPPKGMKIPIVNAKKGRK